MKEHIKITIADDDGAVSVDRLAMTNHTLRESPIIAASDITITTEDRVIFGNYIGSGDIYAENADGKDLSEWIQVTPANEETAALYDDDVRIFGASGLITGEYKFILSVVDITDDEYFGKESRIPLYVTVEPPPPEEEPEEVTE